MSLSQGLLQELQQESKSTRQHLERVAQMAADYKPAEKSMTAMELASHIVESVEWGEVTLLEPSFDMPADYKPWIAASTDELVTKFDQYLAKLTGILQDYDDSKLFEMWTMTQGGQTLFTMPRMVVLRSFIMNHQIHHRAQLGLYLRMNGVAVPQAYGPTADETDMMMGAGT